MTSAIADLAVDETSVAGARVVAVRGELDIRTAPRFRQMVRRPAGSQPIVLDLNDLSLLDSSGLGAMIELFNATQGEGGRFAVIARRATTRRVFEVLGLSAVLGVFATRREALARVSANGQG